MNHIVNIFQPRRRDARSRAIVLPSATDSLSSSSDGSVPTPEDDPDLSARSSTRLANWLKSSSTRSSSSSKPKPAPVAPIPVLSPLPRPPPSDSDDDSDDYGDEDTMTTLPDSVPPPLPKPPPIPASSTVRAASRSPGRSARPLPHRSHQNLRDITLSAINQRPPCPPFLHAPSGPVFPRSSNPSRILPVIQTTRIVYFKTNIVHRLEAHSLTHAEQQSIAPFYDRSKHNQSVFSTRRRLDLEDVSDLKDAKRVQDFSHGLQRWINRPCFEERCVAWHWDSDAKRIVHKPIQGSGKAVASLEFSEGLEAMAGFGLFPAGGFGRQEESLRRLSVVPPLPRLDIQITGSSSPSPGPATPKSASPLTSTRKTTRFAPVDLSSDDNGDNVPLGIHLTNLTMREEQEREDRKKKVLAAEVVKARMRANAVRTGAADRENLHDHRQTYSRPTYDTHASFSKLETGKHDPRMPDATTKPPSIRSTTWSGDMQRHRPFPAHSSLATSDGSKSQRRTSMLGPPSDTGGQGSSSCQPRSSVVLPLPPPFPMMQSMPVYPLQLQPMIPVFMQPGFMAAPSSPNFDPFSLPLPPPIRSGLPVSRSAERLVPSARWTSSTAGRRATAGPEEMRQYVEQMKRSGLHKELPGRSPLATTEGSRRDGRGHGDRNQTQRKPALDSRSQSGRVDDMKRVNRMPSAISLPPKQSSTALLVSR